MIGMAVIIEQQVKMKQKFILFLIPVLSVALGCNEEENTHCIYPTTIADHCGAANGYEYCDCSDQPHDYVGYVFVLALPSTFLVSEPNIYRFDHPSQIKLVCLDGGGEVPLEPLSWFWPHNILAGYPIKAEVSDAVIVKHYAPAGYPSDYFYELEIQAATQVQYFMVVNDSTEVFIGP